MKIQTKFWLINAVALNVTVGAIFAVGLMFWQHLPMETRLFLNTTVSENFGYFFIAASVLMMAFGFAASWIFKAYVNPINRLSEQIDLINTVNPDLRVTVEGGGDVQHLARRINQSVEMVGNLQKSQAQKLKLAQSETQAEKAVLAALLADLPQGILVCNIDGGIVFYNHKVKDLLTHADAGTGASSQANSNWIGLGRSIFSFIDEGLVRDALDRIGKKIDKKCAPANERFLIGTKDQAILPAELRPVMDSEHRITGFIIYIEDLMASLQHAEKQNKQMQLWQHQLTQSLSVVKAASEILLKMRIKSYQDLHQMVQLMSEHSDLAARLWTEKSHSGKGSDVDTWPLTTITVEEWLQLVSQQLEMDLERHFKAEDLKIRISIDVFHLTRCVVAILEKIQGYCDIKTVQVHFYQRDAWLYIDIIWKGRMIEEEMLKEWKAHALKASGKGQAIPVSAILKFHKANLWPYRQPDQLDSAGLRLLIPTLGDDSPPVTDNRLTVLTESRPEFYDFDLFQQAGQSSELDNRLLSDLAYTVFDTETTGLDPDGGDEIISIGAVRIVNGRLLKQEQFDQLIDPKRHLPLKSIKFHGIRPEMLADKPTIEEALPMFQRFVQDTILVGHNVAFDMRMLQVKEAITGIRFKNPVLDTMLLSSALHPNQKRHSLDDIAQRLGVSIVGRHTAMGDAAATAQIFLKLIFLLAKNNIHTLKDARMASQKSYYARLKY